MSSGDNASSHREYFNGLAETWDEVSRVSPEVIARIIGRIALLPGHRVLDVGTGTGILLPYIAEKVGSSGRVWALDVAEQMLARARENLLAAGADLSRIEFVHASAEAIPLPNSFFDAITCFSAFPHFDKRKAIAEMSRVLKDKGFLLIAHAQGRDAVNGLHERIGGIVANDFLPDHGEMKDLLDATGLREKILVDSRDEYILVAEKP